MKAIGLDIGTTTISALVLDVRTGEAVDSKTVANNCQVTGSHAYESMQDPAKILETVQSVLEQILSAHPGEIAAIGLTGQMHGILYLDSQGNPVSNLYIWQDGRGNLPFLSGNYADDLSKRTGYSPLATGYGSVTNYVLTKQGQLPDGAACFCTIGDYVGMKLTGQQSPQIHPSNAASLGVYSPTTGSFDCEALSRCGIDAALYPAVVSGFAILGKTAQGIPVAAAIGDNQASFIGSVRDMRQSLLINIGTGGQISIASDYTVIRSPLVEMRPLTSNTTFILVKSSLCAGSAYALLEQFFRQCVEMATGSECPPLYERMNALLEDAPGVEEPLRVSTLFRGTRQNPNLRGSIQELSVDNFTPKHFIQGTLEGILTELMDMMELIELSPDRVFTHVVGSGNGLRRNKALQQMVSRRLGLPLVIPEHKEEASYGAALYALVAVGMFPSIEQAQRLIRYREL